MLHALKNYTIGGRPATQEERLKEGILTGLGTGILDAATVKLGSRNAEMTLVYDITPLVS